MWLRKTRWQITNPFRRKGASKRHVSKPLQTTYADPQEPERFDEAFYLRQNADIADAVSSGRLPSGLAHFNDVGRFENRAWCCRAQLKGVALSEILQSWREKRYGNLDLT